MRADEIAGELVQALVADLGAATGSDVLLMINGFGATPLLELHLMYDAAARQRGERGLRPSRSLVGNYVTSLDMAGCSVTVTLLNDELTTLWDAPVHTAALRWRM
jgi:dihydroxyacetone kinase-like protein